MQNSYLWWQKGIIYQIYPRSFQDTNGDGIGDLPGILQRLDYIQHLGVDAIWLSPIYPSPMADFGYDVQDYTNIHPIFGTLEDFDQLLAETHQRGLKLLIDLVPNHTSHEHAWFKESRSSRTNPKRDWYIWRDPAPDGGPPNNWVSFFGGPAWTLDPHTGQYYLHQFLPEQPELNYRNPDVLPAMLDIMRFWLDRGVDGFRVDVIWLMMKDEALRDEPPNPNFKPGDWPISSLLHIYTQNHPEVHNLIRQMRAVLDEYSERMMVGEIYLPNEELAKYYGERLDECHLPFNFRLIDQARAESWNAAALRQVVTEYHAALPADAWPNWVLGNHDQHRIASRLNQPQARVANMLLLTLHGTPTTYYGEELGLENVPIPLDRIQDPPALNLPELADSIGRDPERTPMQWDASQNAGFTLPDVSPWLPVASDSVTRNAAAQEANPFSMLALYRALTRLRRAEPALHAGKIRVLSQGGNDVFAYLRLPPHGSGADRYLVVLNLSNNTQFVDLPEVNNQGVVEMSTALDRAGLVKLEGLSLRPNEGLVIRLPESA